MSLGGGRCLLTLAVLAAAILPARADGIAPLRALTELRGGGKPLLLEARAVPVRLGGSHFDGMVYNGDYAGPLLRVKPGDLLRIHFVNRLAEPTNLHFHGIETSPQGHGDNMHVMVGPGESVDYAVRIPRYQPPGLYWYHAHEHGLAERQVMSGLSGALLVDGFADQFPELKDIKERVLVLKDYNLDDPADDRVEPALHGLVQTVNGALGAHIDMAPGETQLWHVANESADRYFHLAVPGLRFRIVGRDGVATRRETAAEVLDVAPAGRVAVLVDAVAAGSYPLLSRQVLTGTGAERRFDRVLGEVLVAGAPGRTVPPLANFPVWDDLTDVPVDATRSVVFTQDDETQQFMIDGRLYDHRRIDLRVPLGHVEDWTIRNDTDDFHTFHIHQIHFQVIAVNGQPQPFDGLVDVVRVPERGSVTLRLPFVHREILGTFMYHCHVLKHEDRGMMANIEVYDPARRR